MTRGWAGGRRLRWAAGVRAGRVTRGGAEARREVAPTSRGRVSNARPGRGRWAGPLGGHSLPRTRRKPKAAAATLRSAAAPRSVRASKHLSWKPAFFFFSLPKAENQGEDSRDQVADVGSAQPAHCVLCTGGCSGPSPGSLSTSRDTKGADAGSGGRPPFGSASSSLDSRPGHVRRPGLGGPPRHRWVPEARPAEPQLPL